MAERICVYVGYEDIFSQPCIEITVIWVPLINEKREMKARLPQ